MYLLHVIHLDSLNLHVNILILFFYISLPHDIKNFFSCLNYLFIIFQIGDFFLLHLLGKNMEIMQFGKLIDDLSLHLQLGDNIQTAPSLDMVLSPLNPPINLRVHREKEA